MVLKVQKWLNSTYKDNSAFKEITEDGITGTNTCKALIRAMQIELGVSPVDGLWESATDSAYTSLSKDSDSTDAGTNRRIHILQGGLYCKGYAPGGFTGIFGNGTANAIKQFESDAGLTGGTGIASGMILKALLNTDAYVLISGGDSKVREIQQALNNQYSQYIGLIPCDGVYAKATCCALITGLQVEQKKEYPNTVIDGIWGINTMSRCPTLMMYGMVTNRQYVYLLQYALYVNGYDPNGFDGTYYNGAKNAVKSFQSFAGLAADGIAGKQTWASLLVSYGDADRTCHAIDCMTPIMENTAVLLTEGGITAVGRYLTGGSGKELSIEELRILHNSGIKLFPIYQTTGNHAGYFSKIRGRRDAYLAFERYGTLHIANGGTVYFAVDYDAAAGDISSRIIPYFEGISERLTELSNDRFAVGVYAPRYVCTKLCEAGLTFSSFICDMSSGFSCNIGHKLPENWAFDQIKTTTLSNGICSLEVDNDFSSERDTSIAVDPDNYQESSGETAKEMRVIRNVFDCFDLGDFDILQEEIEYDQELPVGSIGGIDISYIIKHSATSPAAPYKISIPVSNHAITSTEFTTELGNVSAQIPMLSQYVNYEGIAAAIDFGMIQIEVSAVTKDGAPGLAVEITSIATQTEDNQLEYTLSIGLKFILRQDSTQYRVCLQTAGTTFTEEQIEEAVQDYEQNNSILDDIKNRINISAVSECLGIALAGGCVIVLVAVGGSATVGILDVLGGILAECARRLI